MKVLVLAQYFAPDMGGGSTRATNVVKGLQIKGCEVSVVTAFPHYPHGRVSAKYKHKAIVPESFENAEVYRVWIPSLPHSNVANRVILHLCFIFSSLFALPFIGKIDVVWAIGPVIMMKVVADLTKKYNLKTIVSLNPIMVDGTGMCGGCRVTVGDKIKFACVDGPEFDGHMVDFNNLMLRNRRFIKEEEEACKLQGEE